jgi:SAM-dependent methyltransferase
MPTDHPYRDFEHAGWERAAEAYAGTFEAATRLFASALLDAVAVRGGGEVLDVACGTGSVTAMAAARGAAAQGVDFSARMIAEATRRHPDVQFREADAEALPFDDAGFDAVAINFGVHHFAFPRRALCEARRVLRIGGRAGFTVWASPEDHALHRIALDAVRSVGDVDASLPAPPDGVVNEPAMCSRLLVEAGFDATQLQVEKLSAVLRLDSVADLIDLLQRGTVRLSALIDSLPRDKSAAVLAAVRREAAKYERNGRLEIPLVAILAVATRT